MEFSTVDFNGVLSSSNGLTSLTSDQVEKQKWCGSNNGFLKDNNGDVRASKFAKFGDDFSTSKTSSFAFSDVGQQEDNMLSFSSSKLESFSPKNNGYPCFGGSLNASMYVMNGVKGPFTPSQWLELEQQAMIYKYITANEPIPPNLLIPIARAFESVGFSNYPGAFLRPNSFGWGPFHLGFSNSTDPEPGRCRRTDGKKWRCSRDAVPDQKYCERHINRGRHRSRKPVEGQVGHSISGATTRKATPTTNLTNAASSSSSLVVPGGGSSNSFAITLNQNKDLHPVTRMEFLSPSISLSSSGKAFSIDKEQIPYAESVSAGGFAGLKSDALVNSTRDNSSLYRTTYRSSCHDLSGLESNPQNPDRSSILWPEMQTQTDHRTQLSISIPVALPADFMSSTSSPTGERATSLSPLRLSRAFDTVEMGLGVGIMEQSEKQANWVPISWETSMGGPLGEALKTSSNSSDDHNKNNTSALNLLHNGWGGSSQPASSPNNVLQRTALGSLSTSSAGSSPRAENGKPLESGGG